MILFKRFLNESYNPYFSAAGPGQGRVGGSLFSTLSLSRVLAVIGVVLLTLGLALVILARQARSSANQRGLSLVELLVVVGILSVLASIGVVHFQHAQVRGKVARAHSDLRVYRDAVVTYRVDNTVLPRMTIKGHPYYDRYQGKGSPFQPISTTLGPWITTPIAYLSEFDKLHPFDRGPGEPYFLFRTYGYHERQRTNLLSEAPDAFDRSGWGEGGDFYLVCPGPAGWIDHPRPRPTYDPTNGVVSQGFLFIGLAKNSIQP